MVSARSMREHPLDGLGGDALAGADDGDELVEEPLGEGDLAGLAVSVIRLPRTWTSASKARSMRARCSSPGPRRLTMLMLLGTTTTCWWCRVPGSRAGWAAVQRWWLSVMDARAGGLSGRRWERVQRLSMLREAAAAHPLVRIRCPRRR